MNLRSSLSSNPILRTLAPRTTLAAALAGSALLLSTSVASAQAPAPRYRSPRMRTAGIVLTSIAGASLAAGLAVIVADRTVWSQGCEDSCGWGTFLVGLPLVAFSLTLAGTGVPLWVVGSRPPSGVAELPRWMPTPVPARNGAALRWAF